MTTTKKSNGNYPSWEELFQMEGGTIIKDWFDEGVRCLIIRGPNSLCAYVGVPIDHPLAGKDYDDVPLDCHGGLTFAGQGAGQPWPKGWYWYGWDYAHSGDYCFFYDKPPFIGSRYDHLDCKKWGIKDVIDDMWHSVYQFKKLMKLVEILVIIRT